jgi:acetylornithine deacetylase/succinyl-diaminopimelate desuccinylase-like protein
VPRTEVDSMSDMNSYLEENRQSFEEDLCEFLRIPSVSTDSNYRDDVRRAGQWVAEHFSSVGLETEVIETPRHPIVFAQSPPVPGAPTVLVYGHFDVQPPDPLDEWTTPPFEPTVRDGNVYARGATDDKGQMLTHVKSVEAWLKTQGSLPVQIKFLIEGEEEVGRESVTDLLMGKYDSDGKTPWIERLKSDIAVVSDNCQFGPGKPAITYGLRGIAYFELRVSGPKQDLHSGTFGGAVTNPANALARMLTALVDENGRVQIPGFYDDVVPLTEQERKQFEDLPFSEESFMQQIGVTGLSGEEGYSTLERRWARPTYDVNGLWSGYQGEGAKTVLPARAGAKFSFRLVPNQDPAKVRDSLASFLKDMCPPGIEIELIDMHGGSGVLVPLDSPFVAAADRAIEQGFGVKPVFTREGGSIPIVSTFRQTLGVDTLLLGWGLDDDNTHSPNEKFCLADFHRGIKASAHLWGELGKISLE